MSIFSTQHLDLFHFICYIFYMALKKHIVVSFYSAYSCMREGGFPLPFLTSAESRPAHTSACDDDGEANPTGNNTIGFRLSAYLLIVFSSQKQLAGLLRNVIGFVLGEERSVTWLCTQTSLISGSGFVGGDKLSYVWCGGFPATPERKNLLGF